MIWPWTGSGLGESFGLVRSASSDKHPRQHDVKQEVQICSETKPRSGSQTTGAQGQNQGAVNLTVLLSVFRMSHGGFLKGPSVSRLSPRCCRWQPARRRRSHPEPRLQFQRHKMLRKRGERGHGGDAHSRWEELLRFRGQRQLKLWCGLLVSGRRRASSSGWRRTGPASPPVTRTWRRRTSSKRPWDASGCCLQRTDWYHTLSQAFGLKTTTVFSRL